MSASSTRAMRFPRLLIENVSPAIDCGRSPVKRIVGDRIEIGADIFKDGHDRISARVCFRLSGEHGWHHAPLVYDYNPDRWFASFVADRVGCWEFLIEAWPDGFATWRSELARKAEARQDISLDLAEGAAMIDAAARRGRGEDRTLLREASLAITDHTVAPEARLGRALDEDLAARMARQIDPKLIQRGPLLKVVVDSERARFGAWYELFPRSQAAEPGRHGTFADVQRQLDRIAELGFDVIYLPPIHPIGHTFRKGRNNALTAEPDDVGSPWAIGSEAGGHDAIEPRLGTFADFAELVEAADRRGIAIALDFALQCSPDHPWVREHPEWFFIRADGSIKYAENPPKKYQDIYPINFWCRDREGLWNACRDLVRFWIGHGVRIFRVDNPHTKPLAFWEWLIASIKQEHPDVIFLAEAFTRPNRMNALARLGFTQSYSYFTWRNHSAELREYLTQLTRTELAEYYRPNFFANTPDILHEYLQHGGRAAFRVRLVLAATLSPTYGIYSGFELCENVPLRPGSEEYLDSEKYQLRHRDWQAEGNINAEIARINRIRRENPALQRLTNIAFHPCDNEQLIFYSKRWPDGGNVLLIIVNLDPHRPQESLVTVPIGELGISAEQEYTVRDLLSDEVYRWRGERNYVRLDPNQRVAHILRLELP